MKISRNNNLHFRSEKYSNAAERYASYMSAENPAHTIQNILTEAAEFRCQILAAGKFCLEEQGLIIRGLYLSKKSLEYQKSSTRFRFSFQRPDEYTLGKRYLSNKKTYFQERNLLIFIPVNRNETQSKKELKQQSVILNDMT